MIGDMAFCVLEPLHAPGSVGSAARPCLTATKSSNWATETDWLHHQDLIKSLYKDENRTLKQVMQYMVEHHQFRATPKMFKRRLKLWKVEKNIKTTDLVTVVQSEDYQDEAHRPRVFVIDGRKIETQKVQQVLTRRINISRRLNSRAIRAQQRQGDSINPPSLPSIFAGPDGLRSTETAIHLVRSYVTASLDTGKFIILHQDWDGLSSTKSARAGRENPFRFYQDFRCGIDFLQSGFTKKAFRAIDSAFNALSDSVAEEHPLLLIDVVEQMVNCRTGYPELSNMLTSFFRKLCIRKLGPRHPLTLISHEMQQRPAAEAGHLLKVLVYTFTRVFEPFLLHHHANAYLEITRQTSRVYEALGHEREGEQILCETLARPEIRMHPRLTLRVRSVLARSYLQRTMFVEAESLAEDLLQEMASMPPDMLVTKLTVEVLETRGRCRFAMGDPERAKEAYRATVSLCESYPAYFGHTEVTLRVLKECVVRFADDKEEQRIYEAKLDALMPAEMMAVGTSPLTGATVD